MGENDDEHIRRALNRPYYNRYAMTGKTIYVYTIEEWGITASSGGGDHNLIRSFYFSLAMTVLMAPVSLACLVLGVLALFKMPLATLVMVFFGTLFGFAFLQCWFDVKEEWRGRKARKLNSLPKPWWVAADDHAYEWFLTRPDPRIQMTLDYFPYSVKLRNQEAAW